MARPESSLRSAIPDAELPKWAVVSSVGREISKKRITPLLRRSRAYKRSTGYFSARALLRNAEGIHELIRNGGQMHLILGAHDIPQELIEASRMLDQDRAKEIVEDIGNKIVRRLDFFVDKLSRETKKCLAWMLMNQKLLVRVAIPRDTYLRRSDGIFHQKSMIFEDGTEIVTATGSGNETVPASMDNGEKWAFHFSWVKGHDWHVSAEVQDFDAIWNGEHEDYFVFSLPEAIEEKLWSYYEEVDIDGRGVGVEPQEYRLGDVARVLLALSNHKYFWHFSLGPVRLYPHQIYVADEVLKKYPVRRILADEVGLGKTIEAGAVMKRLSQTGLAKRILVLTPGGLVDQWKDEMHKRFGMRFWSFDSTKASLLPPADGEAVPCSNPFDDEKVDLLICSWHYARKKRPKKKLLESSNPFDVVVIDEAHAARKRDQRSPTLLYKLASDLSSTSPNVLLMTATPIQIDPREVHDLLVLLGFGGSHWVDPDSFEKFYRSLSRPELLKVADIERIITMVREGGRRYFREELLETMLLGMEDEVLKTHLKNAVVGTTAVGGFIADMLARGQKSRVTSILPLLAPVHWYMVRNTREALLSLGPSIYRFPERRIFDEVVSTDNEEVMDLRNQISDFIRTIIPRSLEEIEKEGVVGFMKSIFWQRFCSSLHALRETLLRRQDTLKKVIMISTLSDESHEDLIHELEIEEPEDVEDVYSDLDLGAIALEMVFKIEEEIDVYGYSDLVALLREEIDAIKDLTNGLQKYSQDPMKDPKVGATTSKIRKAYNAGKKLLVFSRYTDTIDILLRGIRTEMTVPYQELALFTGDGAFMFDGDYYNKVPITKDEISNGLEEGRFSVVLCSDAASEGFNLHAASVVINVDIPWNPAKLEQRIGRADRLGHDPSIPVEVHYIWYSEQDSVERKMYQMIMKRQDLKKMIIGPAQEIVSRDIAEAVRTGERINTEVAEKTAKEIEQILKQNSRLFQVMEGLRMEDEGDHESLDARFESCLRKVLLLSCADLGIELEESDGKIFFDVHELPEGIRTHRWGRFSLGKSDYLSLAHPVMEHVLKSISEEYPISRSGKPEIISVVDSFNDCVIFRESDEGREKLTPTEIIRFVEEELESI